ncbi:MAG: hypothetical protein ACRCZO_05020 [Cetobacterium sp.]|uniref:hypothetical protein n=1 Tax=Cetobacterium sp. TaxID=2071632 RepID=UPI003F34B72E
MNNLKWIEWVFSGIGVLIITIFVDIFKTRKKLNSMEEKIKTIENKIGNNSNNNNQAGRDINIGGK